MNIKTLERTGSKLRFIDQTKLPLKLVYRETDDYREIIQAIKKLEIRGAPAIGIAAAYGMAIALEQNEKSERDFIEAIADEFKAARPTAVNLSWAVNRLIDCFDKCTENSSDLIADLLWKEAEAIHQEDRTMCENIGKRGASLLKDGDAVLTHCNAGALATGGIGTALGVIYTSHQMGRKHLVFADETRPLLQGARLTTWELKQEGIDVTLICDNTAGMLMQQGKIDCVFVGADRIARNGDFANKIGTYPVAVLAQHHQVPFYVAAPSSTFDDKLTTGDEIIIEERSPDEVTRGFGQLTAPKGTDVYSPAFDVTPGELVTAYITDWEILPGGRADR